MFLAGEFADAQSTAGAIDALQTKGFDADALELFSTEPVDLPAGVLDRGSRMTLAAVGGAVTLCLAAAGFVGYTQHDFPLITGGMPLFSLWATGVIFYEMTMLGAIAATFLMFLWESGLLRRAQKAPRADHLPVLNPGCIHLRVRCEPNQVATAAECLYQAGATSVKKAEKVS